ncbi:biotin synthase BioB [Paremcibacter congregatus]|uniref:Biotin synthase n=1 Tax=Paremcibacter congregatus TaxID=2043170 RepID=A0A2G4YPY0_9PROT|nr:biotin synthase BioB [Paremcibacter congregatus]PHZ84347.1 biotin synthase BioB [Paremcibacter congregatus]QDE28567.1 biotin synthase BioB [Paremcibacter congregatus]
MSSLNVSAVDSEKTAVAAEPQTPYADGFRHNWTKREILAFFDLPLMDLLFQAQTVHREYFDPNRIQLSQLCSIKTGGCPEDCKYCPQSSRYQTDVDAERLMAVEKVLEGARNAKANGATRYCMGAAWRSPKGRDMAAVTDMIKGVKDLGLESCMTLGMLDADQAAALKKAGLDYYNHNVDSSPEYYKEIITTRTYEDRLNTLENVRGAGINVCSGGIVGMGETKEDRAGMLQTLANLPTHPGSVPINMLVQVEGTPLYGEGQMDPFDFIRTIAVARLLMPASYVRLSAGREAMSDEMQAMCFMAGANSIFYGEKLLTTSNPLQNTDLELFARLGITPEGQ